MNILLVIGIRKAFTNKRRSNIWLRKLGKHYMVLTITFTNRGHGTESINRLLKPSKQLITLTDKIHKTKR